MVFHDPLAAAVIFNPDICEFVRGEIEIELQSQKLQGYCHWQPGEEGSKEVAVSVNPGLFFAHYFQQFAIGS
jgi:purine nucleosidase